jgi:hypothetical protein
MNMKKQMIDFLLNNPEILKQKSWYEIGTQFGYEPPDKKRAEIDKRYERESIKRPAHRDWQRYLRQKDKLELTKETYKNEKLLYETYKKVPEDVAFNKENFEVIGITTNPHGGAWVRYGNKEKINFEELFNKAKEIFSGEILPEIYLPPKVENTEYGLFIYGADKHIGAKTEENSVYKNPYDRKEIGRRIVDKTIENILQWYDAFGTLESLYIMDLGDALDGFNQKTTRGNFGKSSHILPQQYDNKEQFEIYLELHKNLFDRIVNLRIAKNIFFIGVGSSNHGGDFEFVTMKAFETYLNLKYPFIKTFISGKLLDHFYYGNHCIIFSHGNDDKEKMSGFPLVLDEKTKNYISNYMRINNIQDCFTTVVSGDLHQTAETFSESFKYRKVLSQFGNAKWGHVNFGFGFPGLSSDLFEKNSNKIYSTNDFFIFKNISNTGVNF